MLRVVVAGGTDGIGLCFAQIWSARRKDELYVLGRNFDRAERVLSQGGFSKLVVDIRDTAKLQLAISALPPVDIFVNTIGTFLKQPACNTPPTDVMAHFELNAVANINLTSLMLPKLNPEFSQILACLSTLATDPRKLLSLQSATKAAYYAYLRALREELPTTRIAAVLPARINTGVFEKGGDSRDTSSYPGPECVAEVIAYLLQLPRQIQIPELSILSR